MKFEIFNKPRKPKEKSVMLRIGLHPDGCEIVAVDDNGDPIPMGRLLRFEKSGKIFRLRNINPDLGFALDECGRIKLEEE